MTRRVFFLAVVELAGMMMMMMAGERSLAGMMMAGERSLMRRVTSDDGADALSSPHADAVWERPGAC